MVHSDKNATMSDDKLVAIYKTRAHRAENGKRANLYEKNNAMFFLSWNR